MFIAGLKLVLEACIQCGPSTVVTLEENIMPASERWSLGIPSQPVEIRAKVAPASCVSLPLLSANMHLATNISLYFQRKDIWVTII